MSIKNTVTGEVVEIWKTIDDQLFPGYEASSLGRIRHNHYKNGKVHILKGWDSKGYRMVSLNYVQTKTKVEMRVHRLVASAFLPLPGPEVKKVDIKYLDKIPYIVNHIDSDKSNNLPSNLEWTNHTGNLLHAFKSGENKYIVPVVVKDLVTNTTIDFRSIEQFSDALHSTHERATQVIALCSERPFRDRWLVLSVDFAPFEEVTAHIREPLQCMDLLDGSITNYPCNLIAGLHTGVSPKNILRRVTGETGDEIIAGYVFRAPDVSRPWPEMEFEAAEHMRAVHHSRVIEDRSIRSKQMLVLDNRSGKYKEVSSMVHAAKFMGYSRTVVGRAVAASVGEPALVGDYVLIPAGSTYEADMFSDEAIRAAAEEYAMRVASTEAGSGPNGVTVVCTNLDTGEVYRGDSLSKASAYIGKDRGAIATILAGKKKRPQRGPWIISKA